MANFGIGQRVRIKRGLRPASLDNVETTITSRPLVSCGETYYKTAVTDAGRFGILGIWESMLEPLTDPRDSEWADAQIAKLKKLGSEPHPVREVA